MSLIVFFVCTIFSANGLKRSLDSPSEDVNSPQKKPKVEEDDVKEQSNDINNSPNKVVRIPSVEDITAGSESETQSVLKIVRVSSYVPRANFLMDVNVGFLALLQSFQYLKIHELLRAGCVSKMWYFVSSHRSLVCHFP